MDLAHEEVASRLSQHRAAFAVRFLATLSMSLVLAAKTLAGIFVQLGMPTHIVRLFALLEAVRGLLVASVLWLLAWTPKSMTGSLKSSPLMCEC